MDLIRLNTRENYCGHAEPHWNNYFELLCFKIYFINSAGFTYKSKVT